MWSSSGAADHERSYAGHERAGHLASESSSSSDSESTADDGALRSSPAQSSSPLASPSSSSPSPPRPYPLSTGTLSEFLSWQLHQPVVHSLKTWIQGANGEEAAGEDRSSEWEEDEDRSGRGLWAWCLGGDETFWGMDGYSESENEQRARRAQQVVEDEGRWIAQGVGQQEVVREGELRRRRINAGQGSGPPAAPRTVGPEQVKQVSQELLVLQEHQRRVSFKVDEGEAHARTGYQTGEPYLLLYQPDASLAKDEQGASQPMRQGDTTPTEGESAATKVCAASSKEGRSILIVDSEEGHKDVVAATECKDTVTLPEGGVLTEANRRPRPRSANLNAGGSSSIRAKLASFGVRSFHSLWMVGGFVYLAYMGHMYMCALVLVLQVMMVRELFALARQSLTLPGSSSFPFLLDWHFVCTAMVYMYGQLLKGHIARTADWEVLQEWPLLSGALRFFGENHSVISYALYLAGFVRFVLLLEDGKYMGQLAHFAWNHLVVFLIVCQSSFFAPNIFQGLVWFLLPCFLVIANDCGAYLVGFFWGRTPLIRVSPKKTWEGFVGGGVITTIFAFLLAGFVGRFQWLTCPRMDLSWGPLHCSPDSMFAPQPYTAPAPLNLFIPSWAKVWWITGFQKHALVLAVFASTLAPFGGFFASGVKRALGIKDFGQLIPGHGGVTDRMDCQMLMALFSYVYFQRFVAIEA